MEDPYTIKKDLDQCVLSFTSEFSDVANRYHSLIKKNIGGNIPEIEPKIRIKTTDLGDIAFHVRLFCPVQQASNLQQKITEQMFKAYRQSLRVSS